MKRFTAMRTAKIAAAITGPLMLLLWYLTYAYEWRSDYWLYLLVAFVLISMTPALCADPVAEDEAARARSGSGIDGLVIAAGIFIGSGMVSPVLVVTLLVTSFCSYYSMRWCTRQAAWNAAASPRRGSGSAPWLIAVGLGLGSGLMVFWLLGRPEAAAFFTSLKPRLKDWRLIALMALLCLYLMRMGLRRALAFSMTDLYPHLRQTGKTEA